MSLSRPALFVILVAVAAAAARLWLIWTGWPETSVIADDAYYYFTIARNIADGAGPTFDRLAPTNGFHPLWQLLLVPIWWAMGDSLWPAVRAALSLGLVIDLLCVLVLFRTARQLGGTRAAVLSALLLLLSPFTFYLGMRGMEASLSTLTILLLIQRLARHRKPEDLARPVEAWTCGLLLALAGWARTDNLPLLGLALVAHILLGPGRALPGLCWKMAWLGRAAAMALVGMAPWFLWNLATFGQVVQVSGLVKLRARHLFGELPWMWDSPVHVGQSLVHLLAAPLVVPLRWLCGEEFTSPTVTLVLGPLLAVLGGGLILLGLGRLRRERPAVLAQLVLPLGYMLAHILLYGLVWRSYATWYADPWHALLCLIGGLGLGELWTSPPRVRGVGLVAALLAVVALANVHGYFLRRVSHGPAYFERYYDRAFVRILEIQPQGGVVGAFDAGAAGYVARKYPQLTVVNLDGLVNNRAFEAVEQGRYVEYVSRTADFFIQDLDRARIYLDDQEIARLRRLTGVQRRNPGVPLPNRRTEP